MLALAAEYKHGGALMVLSAAAGSTETKSLRACLTTNRDVSFRYSGVGSRSYDTFSADKAGYECHVRKIGERCYHLVAFSKNAALLRCIDDEALWQHLRRTVTTPMLREWVPEVRRRLENDGRIDRLMNKGSVNAALIGVDDEYMDEVIQKLLRGGYIAITTSKKGS